MAFTSDCILLDPLPEIIAALSSSSFGILPAPDSQPLLEQTFPRTAEELKSVREESDRSHEISERVVGLCRVGLLDGEGHVVVRLDRAGWTVSRSIFWGAGTWKLRVGGYRLRRRMGNGMSQTR